MAAAVVDHREVLIAGSGVGVQQHRFEVEAHPGWPATGCGA
jgi:hypothetical protein